MAHLAEQRMPNGPRPETFVDLTRYPIEDLETEAGRDLVARGRRQLAEDGACVLAGFLLPEAAARARAELAPRLGDAYYCEKSHNPYLDPDDPAFPGEHPRNLPQVSDLGALADDQISEGTVLRSLYRWDRLRDFVAALLEVPGLYPYADPLASLNVNVFQPGQQLGWHFDNADWAVTLMLQPAEAGGVYEYLPWIRSPEDENYEAVARALGGGRDGVRVLSQDVGALVLFRGRYSLHRVTPVVGKRPRLVAVLSYDTEPGVKLTEHNRRLFYGRIA
ncbi:MAG: 2OG-Fe(II) oxygenase [Rhodospirillales bacterium]|nr:2OG-Fe(II) oxygenase [Rhodospirillales bacterium]